MTPGPWRMPLPLALPRARRYHMIFEYAIDHSIMMHELEQEEEQFLNRSGEPGHVARSRCSAAAVAIAALKMTLMALLCVFLAAG